MFTLCVHLYILIRGQGCTYILQYLYVYFAICCISDSFSVSFTISLIILVYFISLPLYKYILYLMLLHGLDDILCISVQPHLNSDLFFFLFFFLFLFFFFFFVLFFIICIFFFLFLFISWPSSYLIFLFYSTFSSCSGVIVCVMFCLCLIKVVTTHFGVSFLFACLDSRS